MKKTDLQNRTELATQECAKRLINAKPWELAKEPPACLAELIDTTLEHLREMRRIGTARLIVELTLMRKKMKA